MIQGPGWVMSIGLLILRVGFGGMMMLHGIEKIKVLETLKDQLTDPLGVLPKPYALYALLFAEVVCAGLVALGLSTRLAAIPLIYAMSVAAFVTHAAHPWIGGPTAPVSKEAAVLYLVCFATIFITGAGRFSIDGLFFGWKRRAV